MLLAEAQTVGDEVADLLRPPRRMLVSAAAEKYVRVVTGSGASVPWDPKITPYMVEPMDASTKRSVDAVIFVGPARCGKTEALGDCRLAHAVKCDPGDFMMLFPTEVLANDFSKRRLRRLHRYSKQIGAMLSRSRIDDSIGFKYYRNGMILNLAWPTSSQVAQRDIRFVLLSDYDSMPDDIGGEGAGFDLAKKRTQAYMSAGVTICESSPKREVLDPKFRAKGHEAAPVKGGVLPLFNRGSRCLWHWQCIHCGGWFEAPPLPSWDENISNLQAASETAFVPCTHCGGIHDPKHKQGLQLGTKDTAPGVWLPEGGEITQGGKVIPGDKRSNIASYWIKGCAAAFQSWSSLVLEHLRGVEEYEKTGSETKLKTTRNIDQGMPYLSKLKTDSRSADDLISRAETWVRGEIPAGVLWLQLVADVQKSAFVVQVFGHGLDRERWLIDRYSIQISDRITNTGEKDIIDPSGYTEDWKKLTEAMDKTYPLSDGSGRRMTIQFAGIDSGGYSKKKKIGDQTGSTTRAYTWWRGLRRNGLHRRVRLIKGEIRTGNQLVKETYPDAQKRSDRRSGSRGDVPILLLNSDLVKDGVAADLLRRDAGTGYVHFPEWLEDNVFEEMVSEVRCAKGWQKISSQVRNEAWDLLAYDAAISLFFGGDRVHTTRRQAWAQEWDTNTGITKAGSDSLARKTDVSKFKVI